MKQVHLLILQEMNACASNRGCHFAIVGPIYQFQESFGNNRNRSEHCAEQYGPMAASLIGPYLERTRE